MSSQASQKNDDQPKTVFETRKLRVELGMAQDQALLVRITGVVNEDFNADAIMGSIVSLRQPVTRMDFDLGKVSELNSRGIREWIVFLNHVKATASCRFLLLSEVFLQQASVIPNMLGPKSSEIVRFEAPYFCTHCKKRTHVILSRGDVKVKGGIYEIPEHLCQECHHPMDFDEIREEYFHFLTVRT